MIKSSHSLVLVATSLLMLPAASYGDSWSCRNDNDVREIHIVQETESEVPCSVVYKKLTEGVEDQVLWTAISDSNYCAEKAAAFVEKQIGWGWTCVETIADDGTEVVEEKPAEEPAPPTEPQVQ